MVSHSLHVVLADWLFLFNVYILVVFPLSYWLVLHAVSIHELVHVFCSLLVRAHFPSGHSNNTTQYYANELSLSLRAYTTFSP